MGLILRASHNLFAELSKLSIRTEYTVRTSFVEIHNEEVHDLFRDNVALRFVRHNLISVHRFIRVVLGCTTTHFLKDLFV